ALHVPLEATIEVCKPFGRTCIRYGQCKPEFLASFHVAGTVSKSYRVSPPRGTLEVKRRCVIGVDVTPRIVDEANKELKAVGREGLRCPRALGDGAGGRCLPVSASHTGARLRAGQAATALGLSCSCPRDCNPSEQAALPPRHPSPCPTPPSELWVPNQVEFHV